jgi:hypothetical protein
LKLLRLFKRREQKKNWLKVGWKGLEKQVIF